MKTHNPIRLSFVAACSVMVAGCVEQSPEEVGDNGVVASSASSISASSGEGISARVSTNTGSSSSSSASVSESLSNGARALSEETDDYSFEYSYPAEAGNILGLSIVLDARLEREREQLSAWASEGRDDARDSGFPFNKYSQNTTWRIVADLPDWLSLSEGSGGYSGGAHGMYRMSSLIWDKAENLARTGSEFFVSADAMDAVIGEQICAEINSQREEKRGAPVDPDGGVFNQCVPFDDLVVLLGSSNGKTFNCMTLYAGPYTAGPYAEGDYEVHLPVTDAVLAAVKPEYRSSFTSGK